MDWMLEIFPFFFIAMLVLVFGMTAFMLLRSIRQWNQNNHSPRLTVTAKVATKRTQLLRGGTHCNHRTSTHYFATFEVESGDRFELPQDGYNYGMLVEGDRGKLTFQGTRFLDFQRTGILDSEDN